MAACWLAGWLAAGASAHSAAYVFTEHGGPSAAVDLLHSPTAHVEGRHLNRKSLSIRTISCSSPYVPELNNYRCME
jgi:hypothetical protein